MASPDNWFHLMKVNPDSKPPAEVVSNKDFKVNFHDLRLQTIHTRTNSYIFIGIEDEVSKIFSIDLDTGELLHKAKISKPPGSISGLIGE